MRIIVVGAGLSGLVAARALAPEHEVTVVDKGRSVGGRLATRRLGEARIDHGAQFFTVRGDTFRAQVDDWVERDLARVWCHGFNGADDGYPRYCGTSGMNALAKDVATGLDCRTGQLVFTCRPTEDGWDVVIDDGTTHEADAVILTCPIPQSWSLLVQAQLDTPESLFRRQYHRTIGLLVVLDGPSAVPEPGAVQFDPADTDAPFGFVADNAMKGISPVPALTFHATQPWSLAHWDDDVDTLRSTLLERAEPYLGGAGVIDVQVKKWRFAGPVEPWPDPCWVDDEHRLVLAGDVFAGPKVEGAFESGIAAAAAMSQLTAG
jgi:renalase